MPSPGAESSPPDRPLLDVPRLITEIPTGYNNLYRVSCLSDEEIWTSSYSDKIMKLFNKNGKLLKPVQTKSGNAPQDIAVTRSKGLVYTDEDDRSINLVTGTQIKTLITLRRLYLRACRPLGLCITSSGDLLVIMIIDDDKQTKVVRYSGTTKKQSIHHDDQGNKLYSSGSYDKCLTENRNLDICVADFDAGAIVVVSAAGKFRFRYTGPPSTPRKSFSPRGITTDSQGNILTSDSENYRIHIIHEDGHFLRYILNCGLRGPQGLCVDSQDNLFVADDRKVKVLQYYK